MAVTLVPIPEEFVQTLRSRDPEIDVARYALQATVVEAVRDGRISRGRGREILGISFEDGERLYAERGILYDLDPGELERQLEDLRSLRRVHAAA